MNLFEGKTVVIAGVGRGLGREVAEVAYREGAQVVLGARSTAAVEELAATLDPSAGRVLTHRLDVTDRASCAAFMAAAGGRFGPLHALVVVAALDTVLGGIEDADWDEWHRTMEVNFFGTLYVISAALPHLATDGAAIVLVGAQTMYLPPRAVPQAAYSASKAAVLGAMRHLTVELGPRGTRVNNVVPGWMWGPAVEGWVTSTAFASGESAEVVRAGITGGLALGEMATDGDVAEVIAFLASDRARGVTGQTLLVNAGEHMQ